VEVEEKKKSSFLCLSTSAFRFLDDIFTWNQKQEKTNERSTSYNSVLLKDDIVKFNMFSVHLTGIVKTPLFKR